MISSRYFFLIFLCLQLLTEAAYLEITPVGGSKYALDLEHLDTTNVLKYRHAHFVRGNLIIAADGIAHSVLEKAVKANIDKVQPGSLTLEQALRQSPYYGGELRVRRNEMTPYNETHAAVAYPVPNGYELGWLKI